jgi:hypothetical protein
MRSPSAAAEPSLAGVCKGGGSLLDVEQAASTRNGASGERGRCRRRSTASSGRLPGEEESLSIRSPEKGCTNDNDSYPSLHHILDLAYDRL